MIVAFWFFLCLLIFSASLTYVIFAIRFHLKKDKASRHAKQLKEDQENLEAH